MSATIAGHRASPGIWTNAASAYRHLLLPAGQLRLQARHLVMPWPANSARARTHSPGACYPVSLGGRCGDRSVLAQSRSTGIPLQQQMVHSPEKGEAAILRTRSRVRHKTYAYECPESAFRPLCRDGD